jgi:hypothetical protein
MYSLSRMLTDIANAIDDPTLPRSDLSQSPGEPNCGLGMSNYDMQIDDGLEVALREGRVGSHFAWNFFGRVWFSDGVFYEEVWRHRTPKKLHAAASLRDLMDTVNNEWGTE